MKLFCREDHTPQIEPPRDLKQELLEARAHLARLRKLPISNFTPRINAGYTAVHSVDRKENAIAYAEAEVAELEILVKGEQE